MNDDDPRIRRTYIDWLHAQRHRDDPVGDLARLAERGRRQIGSGYAFKDLRAEMTREARRAPAVRKAFGRSVSEFWAFLRRVVREHGKH